jgi:hypothetical protein
VILPSLAGLALAAPCPEPVPTAQLNTAVVQAFTAYATAPSDFDGAADGALSLVPCLDEPAAPSLAASLHWIRGMKLLAGGDELASQHALTAAIRIDPTAQHTATGELGAVLAKAEAGVRPISTTPLLLPGYALQVDGKRTTERPVDGPYLLQIVDAGGHVAYTQYVADGEEPQIPHDVRALAAAAGSMGVPTVLADAEPDFGKVASIDPEQDLPDDLVAPPRFTPPPKPPSSGGSGKGKALLLSGLASGGLAAGLYGTSVYSRIQYDKHVTATGYFVTNGTFEGSLGGLALSGILLTTYLIVR